MAVVVANDFSEALQLAVGQRLDQTLFAHGFNQAFGEDDEAILRTFGAALDDGADDDVANFIHGDLASAKFLGMIDSVAAAALAMPSARCPAARPMLTIRYQREVVRASSIKIADNLHAVMPGGFITERRRGAGQRQIVVNRLGHVRDAGFFRCCACATWLAENAVSSPPMVTSAVMPSFSNTVKRFCICFSDLVGFVRAVPRMEPPLQMDVLHVADGQRLDLRACRLAASHLKPSRKPMTS